MEAILLIVFGIIGWTLFRMVLSAGAKTVVAVGKAAVGKGSISENMDLAFKGMGPLDVRFNNTVLNDDPDSPVVKQIEAKGLFPVTSSANVGFVISIFDEDGDDLEPIVSIIEQFQEPGSVVFQQVTEMGSVSGDQGFGSWVKVGTVIPDLLQPPIGGNRNLFVVVRLIDLDDPPVIRHGFRESEQGMFWEKVLRFAHIFEEKGYKEAAEHRDEARGLAIRIGMSVAMADGSLDDSEGDILRKWITKEIEQYTDDVYEEMKEQYNEAMRSAYVDAKNGDLSLSNVTMRLNEIGEKKTKYDAIELCFDVMAADGIADAEEMKVIRKVAEALDLDLDEIEKLRDQKIIGLDVSVSHQASAEELLGIEPDWSEDDIKRHLRAEFQKWNNRLNTLPEGEERENAQRMLDLVSEARKNYG
jgi:tellurite resistance protein